MLAFDVFFFRTAPVYSFHKCYYIITLYSKLNAFLNENINRMAELSKEEAEPFHSPIHT